MHSHAALPYDIINLELAETLPKESEIILGYSGKL